MITPHINREKSMAYILLLLRDDIIVPVTQQLLFGHQRCNSCHFWQKTLKPLFLWLIWFEAMITPQYGMGNKPFEAKLIAIYRGY